MKRKFTAPLDDQRCAADRKPLADGSEARCMNKATRGIYCVQHSPLARLTAEQRLASKKVS